MAKDNEGIIEEEEKQEQGREDEPKDPEPAKTYTDDEVDKIVTKRLAREREKWERKVEEEKAAASEAEKLRGMNDLERAQHESERFRAENEDLRRQLSIKEQMDVARDTLSGAGIHMPDDLLSMFVSDDAEKTKKAVDSVKDLWSKAVEQGVKDELKRNPPKNPNPTDTPKASAGKAFADAYNAKMKGEN